MTPQFIVFCEDCNQHATTKWKPSWCPTCNGNNVEVHPILTDERKAELIAEWQRRRARTPA